MKGRKTVGRLTVFEDVRLAIRLLTPGRRVVTLVAKRLDQACLRKVCPAV